MAVPSLVFDGRQCPSAHGPYNPADDWQRVALHEAGHVLCAQALGHVVGSVTMESIRCAAEPGDAPDVQRWRVQGATDWDVVNASPRDQLMVALAGEAACSLADPDPRFDRFSMDLLGGRDTERGDHTAVVRSLAALGLAPRHEDHELATRWEQTRALLEERWHLVIALATELIVLNQRHLFDSPCGGHTSTINGPDPVKIATRRGVLPGAGR